MKQGIGAIEMHWRHVEGCLHASALPPPFSTNWTLWWLRNLQARFGQVLLSIERVQRELHDRGSSPSPLPGAAPGGSGSASKVNALKVSASQTYDYLLLASLKAQVGRGKGNELG